MDNSNADNPQMVLDPQVYNANWLDLKYMPNLSGHPEIHTCYFNNNEIHVICPDLFPPNVKEVNFYNNSLHADGLPLRWSDTLETIILDRNQITTTNTVPEWSASLQMFSIDDNPLIEVPERLPPNLTLLSMSYCHVTNLINLPTNLKRLRAYYNKINTIGKLPQTLEYIHLAYNQIQSSVLLRHKLPPTLRFLNLDCNKLTSLPATLPETLETLSVMGNMITVLPTRLPTSLRTLIANKNRIKIFKPSWKPGQRLFQLHIRDNCLIDNLIELKEQGIIEDIFQANNWNQAVHHSYARIIQRAFARYKLRKAVRTWARLGYIQRELIDVSYLPELIIKYNDIESIRLGFL